MIKPSGTADEKLRLWFDSDSLIIEARKYPRRCELRFDFNNSHHIVVLHNPADTALIGKLIEADIGTIRIAEDGENQAKGVEGGRYRAGLLDGYDDEIFSTLIDSFEHYSS